MVDFVSAYGRDSCQNRGSIEPQAKSFTASRVGPDSVAGDCTGYLLSSGEPRVPARPEQPVRRNILATARGQPRAATTRGSVRRAAPNGGEELSAS